MHCVSVVPTFPSLVSCELSRRWGFEKKSVIVTEPFVVFFFLTLTVFGPFVSQL